MIDLTGLLESLTANLALTVTLNMTPAILIAVALLLAGRKTGRFKPFLDAAAVLSVTIGALNTGNVLISHFESLAPESLITAYLTNTTKGFEALALYPVEGFVGVLTSQLATLIMQYAASILHTFILWAFVALFSSLLGVLALIIRLLLFERGLGGSFTVRVKSVVFTRIPANPLDEVSGISIVKDYLVIGLVTLPAMVSFSLTVENYYNMGLIGSFSLNIAIYIMLLYRFSYLASSRIAKIGGVKCREVDLGEKMMRSVVGPFTYFNMALSLAGIGNIAYTFYAQRHIYVALQVLRDNLIAELTAENPLLGFMASTLIPSAQGINVYMLSRVTLANSASIIFAIVLLPIFERFAVTLYHKAYTLTVNFREKIRELKGEDLAEAAALGIFLGAIAFIMFYALMAMESTLAIGISDPASASILIYYALSAYTTPLTIYSQHPFTLSALLPPSPLTPLSIWVLSTVLVAMLLRFLLGGASGYLATRDAKPEWIALISALVTATALWSLPSVSTPLVSYITSYVATPIGVIAINIPAITLPEIMDPASYITGSYVFRLASQLAYMVFFDLPIWVLSTTLMAYIAYYAKPAETPAKPPLKKIEEPSRVEPFKLTLKDMALSSVAFTMGLVATTIVAFTLYYLTGFNAVWLFRAVIYEITAPEGIEYWLYLNYTLIPRLVASLLHVPSWLLENNLPIVLIHNFNRCVLSAIGALAFWIVIAGLYEASKGRTNSLEWYVFGAVVFIAEYFLFDDQFTPIAMLAIPLAITALYKLARRKTPFAPMLVKASLYSLCIIEILSTAFVIAGLYMIESVTFLWLGGKGGYPLLISILPHGIIEIPAAILATAIGLSVARSLSPAADKPDTLLNQAKSILHSKSLSATLLITITMFTIAAVIEAYISPQIFWSTFPLLAVVIG